MDNYYIEDGNRLLLVFDDWDLLESPDVKSHYQYFQKFIDGSFFIIPYINPQGGINSGFLKDSKYHSDWNWAMAVVEKVEKMDFGFKMCRKVVEVYIDSTKEVIIKTKESCRKESLFKALVEFVKLYNEQQKSKS